VLRASHSELAVPRIIRCPANVPPIGA